MLPGYLLQIFFVVFHLKEHGSLMENFVYTKCAWIDKDRCLPVDKNEFTQVDDLLPSKWPDDRFVLLTPKEGCPESAAYGWRRGYLSIIWQEQRVLISAKNCNETTNNATDVNEAKLSVSFDNACVQNITVDTWPYSKTNILGPFSKYALRLNFCCKVKRNSTSVYGWPFGSFSLFGDISDCPNGFIKTSKNVSLPMIESWSSNGCIPDFTVHETARGGILQLSICTRHRTSRQSDVEDARSHDLVLNTAYPFIFIKAENETCPKLPSTTVIAESLLLDGESSGKALFSEILELCYFRHKTYQQSTDSDPFIYAREEVRQLKAFAIANPSVSYGNRTIVKTAVPTGLNDLLSSWLWRTRYEITYIPWLILDLGRNLMVEGIQLSKYHLEEVSIMAYKGTLNVTKSGLPCQRWDSSYPHSQSYMNKAYMFPSETVSSEENYCRRLDYEECLWCYTQDPDVRWECCATEVYKSPFSKCFISDDRWTVQRFGGLICPSKLFNTNDSLYFRFLRAIEGRYITLAGFEGTAVMNFQTTSVVKVLTKLESLYMPESCNTDLGMIDGSILDEQISVSSWQKPYLPPFVRPFENGWCAELSDQMPSVEVDLLVDTKIEGITVWNWLETVEEWYGSTQTKVIMKGSAEILVNFMSEFGLGSERNESKTFQLDRFLPVDQPQTFFHEPVVTRYIQIYIARSIAPDFKCLRFELQGCLENNNTFLPELVRGKLIEKPLEHYEVTTETLQPYEKITYIQHLGDHSAIRSNGVPTHYRGGMSYTWIINIQDKGFIKLIFTDISLNTYEETSTDKCNDSLFIKNAYTLKTGLTIDQAFNDLSSLIETSESYMALTFTSCIPTSKIISRGIGFQAFLRTTDIPTCFSLEKSFSGESIVATKSCTLPVMYLSSMSRLNIPQKTLPERWKIHVLRFSIHLQIMYFNVRCDIGSSLVVTDRFSGTSAYCNLKMIPENILSDSDTLEIEFTKGQIVYTEDHLRFSAREGFRAVYHTNNESLTHLIDSHGTDLQVLYRLYQHGYRDPDWPASAVLAYKGCAKTFWKCYSIFFGKPSTWKAAGDECWIRQQRLVSIHFAQEQQLLKYMLRNFRYVVDLGDNNVDTAFPAYIEPDPYFYAHVGLVRVTKEGFPNSHVWEDSSTVTFSAWNDGEPSTEGDCTRMSFHLAHTNNTWEAEDCVHGLASFFICEQPITDELLNLTDTFFTHFYDGFQNQTVNGIPCQRWDTVYPHYHSYYYSHFLFPADGTVGDAQNFCRDPEFRGYIWCFTTDPDERWQKCHQPYTKTLDNIVSSHYTGRLSRTASGRYCQRWDSHEPRPHNFGIDGASFPDDSVEDAGNYCRDPTEEGTLWCYTTDPDIERESCIFKDMASDRCYLTHFDYSSYMGKLNRTYSGKVCQKWSLQSPHVHESFVDSQFPDGSIENANNYCRDPYNDGFLWCYTTDPVVRIEPCLLDPKVSATDRASQNTDIFHCKNGEDISSRHLCDGHQNCQDLSDETECRSTVHKLLVNRTANSGSPREELSLFQCDSSEWVSILARCDDVIDCLDASDEMNCSFNEVEEKHCTKEQFTCGNNMCIQISKMCDFVVDCDDALDEDCDFLPCSAKEFRCDNGQCVPKENRCDAYRQCKDESDENNCEICTEDAFHCDFDRCIPRRLVCDKYRDCLDGSDETSCDQPRYESCEKWWEAGYRRSGLYKLKETEAECDFESVPKTGKIYTRFRNFEVTTTSMFGIEKIHSSEAELPDDGFPDITLFVIVTGSDYFCTQNITQTCLPAYKATADVLKSEARNTSNPCNCFTMTVQPYLSYDQFDEKQVVTRCGETFRMSEDAQAEKMVFRYDEAFGKRTMQIKYIPTGTELQIGPTECVNNRTFKESSVGCGEENNVFPVSVRCVYDTDASGYIIGCRSGNPLQNCENYTCPKNKVKCPGSFCIPLRFICDGEIQCPGGDDEKDCGCEDNEREVIILYENSRSKNKEHQIRSLANQLYSTKSIIRLLKYQSRTNFEKIDFEHRILDIADEEFHPHETVKRQFVCSYSLLASQFIDDLKFSKSETKYVIFIQDSEESEMVANIMFGSIKSSPTFHIYRVLKEYYDMPKTDTFRFVNDIVVKRWEILPAFFHFFCKDAADVYCPGEYKCAASKTCILLEQVCDGQIHCVHGDDERLCQFSCPLNCTCNGYTADCSYSNFDQNGLSKLHENSRFLDLSGNPLLRDVLKDYVFSFAYLTSLYLSNCDVKQLRSYVFQSLTNLRTLDLSFNKLTELPKHGFVGLRKLTALNLFGNTNIFRIAPYALQGLLGIRSLQINGANINTISSNAFSGLRLDTLNITDNVIYEIEDNVFGDLDSKVIDFTGNSISKFQSGLFKGVAGVTYLRTPSFKYCCVRPNYMSEESCLPNKDEISSCEDLMRVSALQTMLWLIGIGALVGNVASMIYRLVFHREKLKLSYEVFVTNLAVADFLMGIYLIIIATADAVYRNQYIFMDDYWRNSGWCTFAGFLSTTSSEASVLFLCFITLDRFLVIKYPFGQIRIRSKLSLIISMSIWGFSVLIALIPIVFESYFQGKFYSKNGVCIALPLTRDRPQGWLYSIIIFVGLNFVTFCLIALEQMIIFMEIKKATSGIRKTGASGRRRELAVAKNLLLVITTDFLCWFPIGCMGLMSMTGYGISGDVYAWTTVFILPINSALNPVLYTLSVILSNKKTQEKVKEVDFSKGPVKNKRGMSTDLFRYFVLTKGNTGQTYLSLDDLGYTNHKLRAVAVLKLTRQLVHCLHLLHAKELTIDPLVGDVLYVNTLNDEVIGDIHVRKQPTVSKKTENRKEDIYRLGCIIRQLLTRV